MQKLFLALFFILLLPSVSRAASVSVTAPTTDACVQAGSSTAVQWTTDGDHTAIYYRTDGSTPSYGSSQAGLVAHPVTGTSYTWTAPSSTQNGKVWVEAHNAGHTDIATALY